MKILLVDDDSFLRDMYALKFKEAKHDVEIAFGGEEAVRILADRGPFDVVVLDMVMPGMTGVEFLKQAQEIPKIEKTSFIVLSNQSEEVDIKAAEAAGAMGYIVKAESVPSQVVKKVEALVSKK